MTRDRHRHPVGSLILLAAALALSACNSVDQREVPIEPDAPDDATTPDLVDPDADAGTDAPDGTDTAEVVDMPTSWTVAVSDDAPEAVAWTAEDVTAYLEAMGQTAAMQTSTDAALATCVPGEGRVIFAGDGLGEPALETPRARQTVQTWRIAETRCEGGALVVLSGGGLLGRQYAGYQWMHELGVRFFHPEEEFVPESPRWSADALVVEKTPPFRYNSVSLHLPHPLELGDPYRLEDERYADEVERYITWCIKNFASFGSSGARVGEVADYGTRRGIPRSAGFDLHNTQQGFEPVIDPDDPRPWQEQLDEAVDERMTLDADGNYPEQFHFTFNPSEFTELDDRLAVEQITHLTNYLTENYPDTRVYTTNHTTYGEPTEHYGVRYYDLSQFAPPELGVKVHTVMFYDLFRPAPVYGNENFNFQYDFMVANYRERAIWHYPEASWWLTFDMPVPLYLPITVEARDRDIQNIAFMLDGGLEGHRVFGSGHEWGYWQNEYCPLRMAADLDYRWTDCLADITGTMGPAGDTVYDVLIEVVRLQERDLIYDEQLLAYLVGTDPETEIAASVGIHFHPLPPSPQSIMSWTQAEVDNFRSRIQPSLERMDREYAALVERLRAVADTVPEGGRPWFDEILDGIEVTGLRARHNAQAYGAVVSLREGRLNFDAELEADAPGLLEAAKETTELVRSIVARREAGYRYAPIERSIGGGPDGTEDDNWTIYNFRYLNRTHHVYYYTRVDDLVAEVLAGSGEAIDVTDTVLATGQTIEVLAIDTGLSNVMVDWGDGSTEAAPLMAHDYAAAGVYDVVVTGELDGGALRLEFEVAELDGDELATGLTGSIVEPAGTEIIEPLMPGLVVGRIDADRVVLGFDVIGEGHVGVDRWTELAASASGETTTAPATLLVPIINRQDSRIIASIQVDEAVVDWDVAAGTVQVTGSLVTEAVIAAVVTVGGFDEEGARAIIASQLGYTADTLPAVLPFTAEWNVASGG